MAEKLLEVEDLKVYYKLREGWAKAVDGVTFSIAPGETIGIVGESGCGKSTLANAIIQVLPSMARINGGRVLFEGRDITTPVLKKGNLDPFNPLIQDIRWKDISVIFQGVDAFNPAYKIGDQIIEVLQAHGEIDYQDAVKKVEELFAKMNLRPERMDLYPYECSEGVKQRALIAMSLALDPKLLIADEPTTALDVMTQYDVLNRLREMQKDNKMSVIFISNDISLVAEIADRILVMYAGRLCEIAPTLELLALPENPYTLGLLNTVPSIMGEKKFLKERLKTISGFPPSLLSPPEGCRFHTRCRFAKERCPEDVPVPIHLSEDHVVWCHKVEAENGGMEW